MSRLTFEFLNDHFNSLGDDDSIVSQNCFSNFAMYRLGFSFCFLHFFFPRATPTADRLVASILPAKIVN